MPPVKLGEFVGAKELIPFKYCTFKLLTKVVLVTEIGAVPVATVEINCDETRAVPDTSRATPGVVVPIPTFPVNIGLALNTLFPVPVDVVTPVPPFATGNVPVKFVAVV